MFRPIAPPSSRRPLAPADQKVLYAPASLHGNSRRRLPFSLPRRRRALLWLSLVATIYFLLGRPALYSPAPAPATHSTSGGVMGRSATPMARHSRRASEAKAKAQAKANTSASTTIVRRAQRVPVPIEISEEAGEHEIRDGLLHVDPSSTVHPIYQLIRDARRAWDDKAARQSTTLKAAVDEYVRRNGRAPPVGFDKWWRYVVDNSVRLPDEYDQISRDMELFHALHPADIERRIAKAAKEPDTFLIKIRNGRVRTGSAGIMNDFHLSRWEGQIDLIEPIAKYLPDMSAVYTVHDTPSNFVSEEHKRELRDHIEDGEYLDESDSVDTTLRGWAEACARDAPLRTAASDGDALKTASDWSFVADHKASMNPCAHPSLARLHGFLSSRRPVAEALSAKFAISKSSLHSDVLGIPPELVSDSEMVELVPWSEKTETRLLWRGRNTGMLYSSAHPWRESHRMRLLHLGDPDLREEVSVLSPPGLMQGTISESTRVQSTQHTNARMFDMAFIGQPIQCNERDGTCNNIADEYPFADWMSRDQADHHKYVVDVDGNAWSARFQRLLMSGSLVFKSTIMPEWYNDRIQPWVHYIPIKLGYTELRDALAFFAGDEHGKGGRDDLAEDIGLSGREWAETFYRKEDMVAYVFRLYLEWARLQAPNRAAMDFQYDPSMEVESS